MQVWGTAGAGLAARPLELYCRTRILVLVLTFSIRRICNRVADAKRIRIQGSMDKAAIYCMVSGS